MSFTRQTYKAIPLAGFGAVLAAVLSGCGGATTGGAAGIATPDSSPVVYGLNAQAAIGGTLSQSSGLGYNGGKTGVLTAATGFKTDAGPGPLPIYKSNYPTTGIPLGFAADGSYLNSTPAQALPTASANAVVFRAYISTGAKGGNSIDLNTSSIVLTSSEAPAFSQPLTFDNAGIGVGPLGQGQYTTGSFALPAALTTTGLHNLHTVVADVAGQKTETDFSFVEVGPADVALFAANIIADGQMKSAANTTGSVGELDNPVTGAVVATAGASQQVVADAQGVIILFAPAGQYIFKTTSADGKTVTKQTIDLSKAAGTAVLQ